MSDPIKVLIVDDEPHAREGLVQLIQADPETEVVGECGDGVAATKAILEQEPDLVLLDVQMPEMDGFGVIDTVGADRMPAVVFVTAYDQFAVKAFEVNALDYLLKPFDDARFRSAMTKAKAAVRSADAAPLHEKLVGLLRSTGRDREPLTRIVVKDAGRVYFVKADDLDWIQAASYYAKLHVGQRTHLLRESMNSLEERLDPKVFFRVSRSAIVNLDRVKEIQPFGGGSHLVILHDGTRVRLSRRRREKLEAVLEQSI